MLQLNDFQEIAQIQTTVFIHNLVLSTSEVLKNLIDLDEDIFNGDPFVLPLPDDAPKEIPRINLNNKKNMYKLEVAPIRINFYRNKAGDEDKLIPDDFINKSCDILTSILENIGVKCDRIALVMNRFCLKDESAKEIAHHFCKDKYMEQPFDRPIEFQIHSLKKYLYLGRFNINSWVRISSGMIKNGKGVVSNSISVQQDINTIVEEKRIFTNQDIKDFYGNSFEELNNILKLYLP